MTMPDPYQTSAEPQSVADRVDQLQQQHNWMPADMQTTLATSQTSDTEMHSIADSIKHTLASGWNGFTEAFHDPVLDKQPTAELALTRYLTSAVGPLPVAQVDLNVIQRNLQKAGYGKALQVNGVWGSDWNAVYNDWASQVRAQQIAGNRPGSIGTAKAAHHWYDALMPSHALNAIGGYIESLPGAGRDLIADVVGSAVNTVTQNPLDQISESHQHEMQTKGAKAYQAVESFLGNPHAHQALVQRVEHPTAATVQNAQTILAIVPIARAGSNAARAAAGEWASGVSAEAAQRGPGVIAKTLFGGRTVEQEAAGAARRGVLNSRVFQNLPLLQQVGPVIGRLADETGAYYKLRTLLAKPYQYAPVRAAGEVGQRAFLTGGAIRATAQAENALGVGGTQTQTIVNAKPLDTIDLSLQRITGTPYAHPFSRAVDSLGFLLHGPLGSTAAVNAVGDRVQATVDHMSDILGQVGLHGIWERAVETATGQKTSIEDLQKAFGGPEYLDRFIAMKTADLAAAHYAQDTAQKEGLAFGTPDYRARVGQLADEVWANPDQHHQAIKDLLAHDAGLGLQNRVAADMVHNNLDPKTYSPDLLDHAQPATVDGYVRNAQAWMQAGDVLTNDVIRAGLAQHMFGPNGRTVIANAQDHFDYGLGQDAPVRLLSTTRRQYVNQVTANLDRVRRQVNDARTQAAKAVTDAEASGDGNLARVARERQAALERALENKDMKGFAATAKKIIPQTRKTKMQWDRLSKDTANLRALVDQGTAPGERLTLQHLIDQGVDPDELYTNVNGEPRIPDQPIGSGDWMRDNIDQQNGTIGLGKLTTKSAQQAAADISRFRQRLETAKDDAARQAVVEEMKNYGFREFGLTEHTLGVFDGDPTKLADVLDERAHELASEVFLTYDAPQHLHDAIQRIRDLGYRPMLGSHIGHLWDSSLPPMPEINGAVSFRRKAVSALGLAPEQISPRTAGQNASIRVLREIDGAMRDPRATIPARTTAETVMQVLRDRNLLEPDMKAPERAVVGFTAKLHRRGIEQLQKDRGIASYTDAEAEYKSEMARALQLRDIPRPQFIKTLTTPGEFENGATWAAMDTRTANLVHRAVLRGYADRPGYIMGAGALEDWARGGFWLGDKLATRLPTSELAQRVANLPNQLVIARNRLRFTLSPFFDFRRVAKQNYKMSLDGVTPVLNPLAHMVNNDTFSKAHKYLNTLIGDPAIEGFDDADRYLHQQSVWGLYNSRHFEAYYAWEKKLQGAADDEIRQGIRQVFEYGSARAGGRSALERTVNTIFFPFSFEKTLLRNTGAYMLTHPQQALLLTGAMSAYDEANKHGAITQWTHDHLPLLRDLQKLNAFSHGLSPGELGGINAPLLNLFMPQTWGQNLTVKNLKRNVPIFNDFGQLLSDSLQQGRIAKNAALNTIDYATTLGAPRDAFDPYRPTITSQAQTTHAEAMRSQFITALAPVLEHNAGTTDPAGKITFPDDPRIPWRVRGQVVNRTSIGELVKTWYPAYNPGSAAKYAQDQARALDTEIQKIAATNPAKAAEYKAFANVADKIQGHLNRGDYDTQEAASLMMTMRQIAVALSETDPQFFKTYTAHYKFAFGPITEVKP